MNSSLSIAQTNVGGGIYSNTTWTKINSPYIVTGNIVLFPGKTLTIEPGVEVKFDGYYNLEIRGTLVALGTITDSISFVSNISLIKGAWDGIDLISLQNGVGFFDFCIIKHSSSGIKVEPGMGNDSINTNYIKNSLFDNNIDAFKSQYGWTIPIDTCVFINNTNSIIGGWEVITFSNFLNNDFGLNGSLGEVRNCLFQNNMTAIGGESTYAEIYSCIIINNNIGITIGNGTITNNTICNNVNGVIINSGLVSNNNISNNVVGVITNHTSSTVDSIEYYVPIKNNHICNNTQYNIENGNVYNKNITKNCFCTTDSTIIEDKLFDGYDDITLGLFNYDIYDSACQNVTQSVYKIGNPPIITTSNTIFSTNQIFSISPNPSNDFISIQLDNSKDKQYNLRIYNMQGQEILQFENIKEQQKTIDCRKLKTGIYLLQFIQGGIIVGQKKLIKE